MTQKNIFLLFDFCAFFPDFEKNTHSNKCMAYTQIHENILFINPGPLPKKSITQTHDTTIIEIIVHIRTIEQ